jgi:hypothetical protein
MKWCFLFSSPAVFIAAITDDTAKLLKQENYKTVLGNRPLVYVLNDQGDVEKLINDVASFRLLCSKAHLGNPYIVVMSGAKNKVDSILDVGDAIADYQFSPAAHAGEYSLLAAAVEERWNALARTNRNVIPTAMTGMDRRPRIEHPVSWEAASQKPFIGMDNYYIAGKPEEIAAHIRDMIIWIRTRPYICPAQAGLIYSWNEHDEGGSTLNPTLSAGNAILRAVGHVLRGTP